MQTKTAQKRSILNKLREMTNVSGIAAEKFFNPEFKKVMESLREKDDQIRSIVAGASIGEGNPGSDPVGLKDLLKSSKSNINRREYMTAVAELGRFHKKIFDIVQVVSALNLDVDKVHHEFLFKDLDEDRKQQLEDLKKRFADYQSSSLIKEASIMDFFVNIGTKRGKALAAWEKRYPQQIGKLKKDTASLLSKSESLLSNILSILKEMASARANRHVDNYVKATAKITKAYNNYDKFFKEYYLSNVKGFLEKVELISPTEKVDNANELGKKEIPVEPKKLETPDAPVPSVPSIPSIPSIPSVPELDMPNAPIPLVKKIEEDPFAKTEPSPPPNEMESNPPSVPTSKTPTIPGMGKIDGGPEFKSDQLAKEMWGKKAHQEFLSCLEVMSGEDPIILSAFIKKYARSIQATNLETSIKLFKIAKTINEG